MNIYEELELIQAINTLDLNLRCIPKSKRTHAICLAAVKIDPYSIYFVPDKTDDICIAALQLDFVSFLVGIENPSDVVLEYACKHIPTALIYISNQSDKLCMLALDNSNCLRYIRNQTESLCLYAIDTKYSISNKDPIIIYIQIQTPAICKAAVTLNPNSLKYIKNQTEELCLIAVELEPYMLMYVRDQTFNIINMALYASNKDITKYIDWEVLDIDQQEFIKLKYG